MNNLRARIQNPRVSTRKFLFCVLSSVFWIRVSFLLIILSSFVPVEAARIKDVAQVGGVRSNQLFGYGLVVGLAGTGDRQNTEFTVRTVTNLLQEYHIKVDPDDVRVKNVAAVIVTGNMPPYARSGSRLDVTVSSMGDATSLSGGILLLTPLKGPDGIVHAVAQGAVSLGGGFSAIGVGAAVSKNHQTVGRGVGGALVERPIPSQILTAHGRIEVNLTRPDFTTAQRVSQAINSAFTNGSAQSLSPGVITVTPPLEYGNNLIAFISLLESLEISPDSPARVVVNERTGTVIIGQKVQVAPVAVAHSSLHITIKEEAKVSQPLPFSGGETVVVPETSIVIEEPKNRQLVELPGGPGVNLGEIVLALNALGVSPRDLIAVFEALKEAGALMAELVIM